MPRQCIFCGRRPVTSEHVFALWLNQFFPVPQGKRLFIEKEEVIRGKSVKQPRRYPVKIDIQAKVVCEKCNGGWMSKMEDSVKGFFPDIHRGIKNSITAEERISLASWATKTAIMLEYANANREPFAPKTHRNWLFKYHIPPPNTAVWIGRYKGSNDTVTFTRSRNLVIEKRPKTSLLPDIQTVFFGIGSLFFVVLSIHFKIKNARVRPVFPKKLASYLLRLFPEDSPLLFLPFEGIDNSQRIELENLDWGETLRFLFPIPPN